jgi:DNA-binding CsgD family transcriptional regulator
VGEVSGAARAPLRAHFATRLGLETVAVLGLGAFALTSKVDAGGHSSVNVAADALTGLAYLVCGRVLIARALRPRFAGLLVLAAAAWFAEDLVTSNFAPTYAVGVLLSSAFDPVLLALLLAYPDGRLRGGRERAAIAAATMGTVGVSALSFVVGPHPPRNCTSACHTVHALIFSSGALQTIANVGNYLNAAAAFAVLAMLVQRYRLRTSVGRRQLGVLGPVAGAVAATSLVNAIQTAAGLGTTDPLSVLYTLSVLLLPACLLLALARSDRVRAAIAELALSADGPQRVRHELARLLGDPTLEIGTGTRAHPAAVGLAHRGANVGWLEHDPALAAEPELLAVAAAVAADALAGLRSGEAADLGALSERERAVLELMAAGLSNDAIAASLHISPKTVERHATAIFDALGVADQPGANRRVSAVLAWLRGNGTA